MRIDELAKSVQKVKKRGERNEDKRESASVHLDARETVLTLLKDKSEEKRDGEILLEPQNRNR